MTIKIVENPKGVAADDTDEKAKCAEFKERLESIRALIADARARLDEEFSVSALEKRCDEIDGKIAELKISREEVMESYANAEIDMEDFIKAAKDLDKQMENLSDECWRVRNDICMKKVCRHDREIMLDNICREIERCEDIIERYYNYIEPDKYSMAINCVSIDESKAVIGGVEPEERVKRFIQSLAVAQSLLKP